MYYYIIIAGLCSKQEDDERAIAEIRKECEALRVEKGDKFHSPTSETGGTIRFISIFLSLCHYLVFGKFFE